MPNMSNFTEYFIGTVGLSIGGALGYFCRTIIGNRLAIERMQISEFNKASAALRAAFAPSLANLYIAQKHGSTLEAPDTDKSLRDAIIDQASAIEIFRPFVPEGDRTAYQDAWEKYRFEVWNYGFVATKHRTDIDDPFEVYESLIGVILKFAEIK